MFKIKILTIGKCKEKWLELALSEYEKRLQPFAQIHWHLCKDEASLIASSEKEKFFLCLDLQGKVLQSEDFSKLFFSFLQRHQSSLSFLIGGDRGIPSAIIARQMPKIQLSSLTFTHQICRLILIEQIYRAIEIFKESPYHK